MAGYKVKTHSGAKKRFKISPKGKAIFQKQGMRHIATGLSRKQKRQLKEVGVISGTLAHNIRRVMPYA